MVGWMILLYLAGAALLILEWLVPGGILGVIGAVLCLGSTIWACYVYPENALLIVILAVAGAGASFAFGLYVIGHTQLGGLLVLKGEQEQEAGWVSKPSDLSLIGAEGEVITRLRPSGTISVNGNRTLAVSNGEYIEEGTKVRVIEVHGNRVVVEAAEDDTETA